jgi:hypothetical protein
MTMADIPPFAICDIESSIVQITTTKRELLVNPCYHVGKVKIQLPEANRFIEGGSFWRPARDIAACKSVSKEQNSLSRDT